MAEADITPTADAAHDGGPSSMEAEREKLSIPYLQDRVRELTRERDALAKSLEAARGDLKQQKLEHSYLTSYMEQNTADIEKRNDELRAEVAALKKGADGGPASSNSQARSQELQHMELVFREKEAKLKRQNEQLLGDVSKLQAFKQERQKLMKKLTEANTALENADKQHRLELAELERAFINARERLQEEARLQLQENRQLFRQQAHSELDEESLRLRLDCQRMGKELRFHEEASESLQQQNDMLREQIKQLQIEAELFHDKDQTYARRGVKQSKLIQELNAKVKRLERTLSETIHNQEHELKQLDAVSAARIAKLEAELETSNRTNKLRTKELKNIRKLAQTILDQRNEVEQFFLEALQQVKYDIKQKQLAEFKAAKTAYNRKVRGLPSGRGGFSSTDSLPRESKSEADLLSQKVQLSDLSLEDRERVLRILFAKLNNSRVTEARLPSHAFDVPLSAIPKKDIATLPQLKTAPAPTPAPLLLQQAPTRKSTFLTE